uniref:Uncharacterized protein n=1 Tax=Anopheles maculatus TaxID=74869 RepID=A0A182S8E4_9DIPT
MNGAVTMGSNEYNSGNNNNSEASPVREEYRKDAESSPPPVKISKRDKERERDRDRRERRERDREREERERAFHPIVGAPSQKGAETVADTRSSALGSVDRQATGGLSI